MSLSSFFLSSLFPSRCLCCTEYASTSLCSQCNDCFPHRKQWQCPYCQKQKTPLGSVCVQCFGKTPLDGIFSATSYKNSSVHRVITAYKYGFTKSLANPLSHFLIESLKNNDLSIPDIILPVPLHTRRLRWRGFNQSDLLAKKIADTLLPNIPISYFPHLLLRNRATSPQAKADNRTLRQKNLANAFFLSSSATPLAGKRIWIVDDVATTGSTLTECARILKEKNAREVWGIVVAS